ncbi:hypothetical protein Franean1_4086 [Parafrankia sp. EAN1pec]|nr:hypothetical protein Franean1_4086 [Frankia sp. EAN1pec]
MTCAGALRLLYLAFILGPNIPTLTRVTRRILRDVDMPTRSGSVFFYVDITAITLSGYNPSSHACPPQWRRRPFALILPTSVEREPSPTNIRPASAELGREARPAILNILDPVRASLTIR